MTRNQPGENLRKRFASSTPLVDANTFVTSTAAMGGGIYTYLSGVKATHEIRLTPEELGKSEPFGAER